MAAVSKTPSGRYRVRIRRIGLPTLFKTFASRSTAQAWARKTESELERSVYFDTSQAQTLKFSAVLNRYSEEVAVTHKVCGKSRAAVRG